MYFVFKLYFNYLIGEKPVPNVGLCYISVIPNLGLVKIWKVK